MEVKLFEVRDRGTFVPCIAIKLTYSNDAEQFLLRRAGYAEAQIVPGCVDEPYVLFANVTEGHITYDAYAQKNRTMARAHMHAITNWDTLKSGDVIDVEFIHGETVEPNGANVMRYDTMLHKIERLTAKYEADIQQLLRQFAKADIDTTHAILRDVKTTRKKLHWTQRPENRARLLKQLKKATKAKHGA